MMFFFSLTASNPSNSRLAARFFSKIACGLWNIEVPKVTHLVADGGSNKIFPEGHIEVIPIEGRGSTRASPK